jgi:uncharacterized protein (DUF1919 family)
MQKKGLCFREGGYTGDHSFKTSEQRGEKRHRAQNRENLFILAQKEQEVGEKEG